MKYLIKPIPKTMIAQLRRGRAIELSESGRNICSTDDFKGTWRLLYNRGLIDIKKVIHDDKEMICVSLTKSGITFLNKYEEKERGFKNIYNIN